MKALYEEGDCFHYICKAFPGLSNQKLKAGNSTVIKDANFCPSMNDIELAAWTPSKVVVKNFLGYQKANYAVLVRSMLENLRILGINLGIKVNFLHDH